MDQRIEIPRLRVDITEAGNTDDELELIRRGLRGRRLFSGKDLYRGIDASRLPTVIKHGTDHPEFNTIYAQVWNAIDGIREERGLSFLDCALNCGDPALLIYRRSDMEPDFDPTNTMSRPKNIKLERLRADRNEMWRFKTEPLEALKAIVDLTY